ncbi:hypothetical protein [Kineococcus sp. SYSU DK005]|uniref:hypothetical protein n=1 Tax=Kineococcus sp. SYSU DK005 TaxID=3383126 RepID=UPI003D7E13BE
MTPPHDAHPARTSSLRGPVLVVIVNLLLGVPGIVPLWLAHYYLRTWPLAALGLTVREPTENDGAGLASALILPIVGTAVLAWFLTGHVLRPRVHASARAWFWPTSIGAVLLPSAALVLASLVPQ